MGFLLSSGRWLAVTGVKKSRITLKKKKEKNTVCRFDGGKANSMLWLSAAEKESGITSLYAEGTWSMVPFVHRAVFLIGASVSISTITEN